MIKCKSESNETSRRKLLRRRAQAKALPEWLGLLAIFTLSAYLSFPLLAQKTPAEMHQQQGIFYLRQHDLQSALAQFRSAMELNPNDALSQDYIGVVLGESGAVQAAIPEFEKA